MPRRNTKEEFIQNSIKIHGYKYDYSKVMYSNNKTKVEIICKRHGSFYQTPNDHIGNHGCRVCSEEDNFNYNMKDSLLDENKNKPIDLYVINLYSNSESFIKVGISKEVHIRHRNIKTKSKYDISSFLIFPCTVEEGTTIERNILRHLRENFKYIPEVKFPGYKECLSISAKHEILNEISKNLSVEYNRSDLVGKILDFEYNK